jgi:hypothetical protein
LRLLQADVAVEHRADGGVRLRIKTVTGEELGVELSPEKAAAHRGALIHTPTEPSADPPASNASQDGAKANSKGRRAHK